MIIIANIDCDIVPDNVLKDFTYSKMYNNPGSKGYYNYAHLTNDVTACTMRLRNLPYMVYKQILILAIRLQGLQI